MRYCVTVTESIMQRYTVAAITVHKRSLLKYLECAVMKLDAAGLRGSLPDCVAKFSVF